METLDETSTDDLLRQVTALSWEVQRGIEAHQARVEIYLELMARKVRRRVIAEAAGSSVDAVRQAVFVAKKKQQDLLAVPAGDFSDPAH